MRIAIIGAGFSGVALAWHLLQLKTAQNDIKITVFDSIGIGGGASGISAGLLHPYSGAHAKLNRWGKEGVKASQKLLQVSSMALGKEVAQASGLFRVALTDVQKVNFLKCAQNNQDVEWVNAEQYNLLFPNSNNVKGAIWIKSALTVNPKLYLEGLWKACISLGAHFEQYAISNLNELHHFDAIIVAMGAFSTTFPELSHIKITQVKGQILELEWPKTVPIITHPLNSQAYLIMNLETAVQCNKVMQDFKSESFVMVGDHSQLVKAPTITNGYCLRDCVNLSPSTAVSRMNPDNSSCIVGATFERDFTDAGPDLAFATSDLMPKVEEMLPALKNAPILDCRSGIRASTPDHLPIAERINDKCWILAGMGSKGLLYHALFAEQLSQKILFN